MERATLWGTELRRFESSVVGHEFELQIAVMAPDGFMDPVPVVYLTDANTSFAAVYQMIGIMQMGQQLPPLCLVGIGYPFEYTPTSSPDRIAEWIRLRAADLFSATVDHTASPHRVIETWGGGAGALVECIVTEIEPMVEELAPVSGSHRLVMGHSAGGDFAAYAALTRPDVFTKALVASPGLLNLNEGLSTLVAPWAERLAEGGAHIFIGVAEADPEPFVARSYTLAGLLRAAAPGAAVETCTLPDENHLSGWAPLYVRGLTRLLGEA